jgi:hypothetical protein
VGAGELKMVVDKVEKLDLMPATTLGIVVDWLKTEGGKITASSL